MAKPRARKSVQRAKPKAPQSSDSGDLWVLFKAKELRTDGDGSITQRELAKEAGVSDDTVSKIERGIGVSKRMVNKVFEALNAHHGKKLKREEHVKKFRVWKR
jgi:DNA-binding XRE family transcriptional regulator